MGYQVIDNSIAITYSFIIWIQVRPIQIYLFLFSSLYTDFFFIIFYPFSKWTMICHDLSFQKKKNVLLHSHSQCFFAKVSLKFSNFYNRRVTSAYVAILLSFMQLIEGYLLATFFFYYSWSFWYKRPITSKSMISYRRNERCQRPKTSWFDFVFPFAFKNKHQFENFFSFIMEGMGTLWPFEFELSQNYRDVKAIISHSVLIFLLNASWVTELVNFIFTWWKYLIFDIN